MSTSKKLGADLYQGYQELLAGEKLSCDIVAEQYKAKYGAYPAMVSYQPTTGLYLAGPLPVTHAAPAQVGETQPADVTTEPTAPPALAQPAPVTSEPAPGPGAAQPEPVTTEPTTGAGWSHTSASAPAQLALM